VRWCCLAGEGEGSVGGNNEHWLPDDGLEVDDGRDEEDLSGTDKALLAEEHKEAGLVEGVHTQVASLLGTALSALLLVEQSETDVGVVGLVDVSITGRVGAGEVKKGGAGALGVAVADAEREGAPVSVGVVVVHDVAVKRADGDHKSGAEPRARRRDGNKGKELKDTIRHTALFSVIQTGVGGRCGVISGAVGDKRTRVIRHKGTVGVLLHNVDVVVVDKVLNDDTGRVHNEGAVNRVGEVDSDVQRSRNIRSKKVQERLSGRSRVAVFPENDQIVGIHGGLSGSGRDGGKPDIIHGRIRLIYQRHTSQYLEGFVAGVHDVGGRHFTLLKYIFFIS